MKKTDIDSLNLDDLKKEYESILNNTFHDISFCLDSSFLKTKKDYFFAIINLKKASFEVYNYKLKKHLKASKKGFFLNIKLKVNSLTNCIYFDIKQIEIKSFSVKSLSELISKIEKYKDNHPEKCYLPKLKKELNKKNKKAVVDCFC